MKTWALQLILDQLDQEADITDITTVIQTISGYELECVNIKYASGDTQQAIMPRIKPKEVK